MNTEPAFPIIHAQEDFVEHFGLTKREFFAAMAMQGICAMSAEHGLDPQDDALYAVKYADALTKELAKEQS